MPFKKERLARFAFGVGSVCALILTACAEDNNSSTPLNFGFGVPVAGTSGSGASAGTSGNGVGGASALLAGSGAAGTTVAGTDSGSAGAGGVSGQVGSADTGFAGIIQEAGIVAFDAGIHDGNTASLDTGTTGVNTSVYDGPCDTSDPPPEVAAWVDETWASAGPMNNGWKSTWLYDSAIKGNGQINICVRYGATRPVTTGIRDQIGPAMQRWLNEWFTALDNYDCFPYASIVVKVTGWAVKPGQESLLEWTDRTIPVYTEISDGSDSAPGEPKCPDACGFFFHPDHVFAGCPGGEANHFDYTLWMNDSMSGGAAAVGGDWGVRIPVDSVFDALNMVNHGTILHEMGHGFGFPDFYTWTGSRPEGGSVMIVGSSRGGLTLGDQWLVKRFWLETKALRYPTL